MKFRRSIRSYKDIPVSRDVLERIMEAGRYTATAKNAQACTFVAVQTRLQEFEELFWSEFPYILEALKETKPDYVRAFTRFYEKWKKDPKDDTFFFNAPCLLITAADNPAGRRPGGRQHGKYGRRRRAPAYCTAVISRERSA